jgi:hypothetical protein
MNYLTEDEGKTWVVVGNETDGYHRITLTTEKVEKGNNWIWMEIGTTESEAHKTAHYAMSPEDSHKLAIALLKYSARVEALNEQEDDKQQELYETYLYDEVTK